MATRGICYCDTRRRIPWVDGTTAACAQCHRPLGPTTIRGLVADGSLKREALTPPVPGYPIGRR